MNPEERDQFTEQLLDATLRQYSTAEPAPGLEKRLLASLALAPPKPKPIAHRWPWMLAAAAVLLIAVVSTATLWHRPAPQVANDSTLQATPVVRADQPTPVVSILSAPSKSELALPATRHHATTTVNTPAPHQELFPTPAPPSEQERLLLSYVDRTPVPELLATNARMAAERDADLKRFFANADPANSAGDAQ